MVVSFILEDLQFKALIWIPMINILGNFGMVGAGIPGLCDSSQICSHIVETKIQPSASVS